MSPVIGVILMVAITVILAAVIGTFVLGLGDQVQQTSPRASIGFDTGTVDVATQSGATQSVTTVAVTHETGDQLSASNLKVLVDGEKAYTRDSTDVVQGTFSGSVNAGSSVTIVGATDSTTVTTGGGYVFRYDDKAGADGNTGTLDINETSSSSTVAQDVGIASGDTVRVVWTSESGDTSATLATFELP